MFLTRKDRKDRKIANQKVMIENRDKLIGDMEEQANVLYQEKKRLNIEIEELKEFQEAVVNIMNNKGTIVDKYDKIKELVDNLEAAN